MTSTQVMRSILAALVVIATSRSGAHSQDPPAPLPSPPDAKTLAESRKAVKELYKNEYSRRAIADKQALAAKLLEAGRDTRNDPAVKYVLLDESRAIGADAGAVKTAMDAVDVLEGTFSLDGLSLRVETLSKLANRVRSKEQASELVHGYLPAVDQAVRLDDYKTAKALASKAERAAKISRDSSLVKKVGDTKALLVLLDKEFRIVKKAQAKLKADPDDPESSFAVGRFTCLLKDDWGNGLPLLAKGSDPAHADLAKVELSQPTEASVRLKLGNGWWTSGMKEKGAFKVRYWARAVKWYEAALLSVGGLDRARTEKRIDAYEAIETRPHFFSLRRFINPATDAVEGNWAWKDGALISGNTKLSRLEIPYAPPEEYDFRIVFTRLEGVNDVNQIVSKNKRSFMWLMAGYGDTVFGFGPADGHWVNVPENPTVAALRGTIQNGRRHTSLVQVRNDGAKAFLDGNLISEWKTDYSRMASLGDWLLRDESLLGLANSLTTAAYHEIQVMEVTGKGKRTR